MNKEKFGNQSKQMDFDAIVTLFIGNIAPGLPDSFTKQILTQCGGLVKWKRATAIKDDLCDFGFADYKTPVDALRAMRIIPQVVILQKRWEAHVDKKYVYELGYLQKSYQERPDYDPIREQKQDQLILKAINELIECSAFSNVVARLDKIIVSPNDEYRETEHYKYEKEIRLENAKLDKIFHDDLIALKRQEVDQRECSVAMQTLPEQRKEESSSFTKIPIFEDYASPAEFLLDWEKYSESKKRRHALRLYEQPIEDLLSSNH